jgi:tetrahydromethanopterin S-methyltransferase subunit E
MRNALRRRFWLETVVSIITGILFVITLILKDWIEVVFRVDPDNNNGTLEWLIVGALLVVTITLFILASYEWRRARAAIS